MQPCKGLRARTLCNTEGDGLCDSSHKVATEQEVLLSVRVGGVIDTRALCLCLNKGIWAVSSTTQPSQEAKTVLLLH